MHHKTTPLEKKLSLFSISQHKIRAIFWDIDGTLTDDQIHKKTHRSLAEKAGYVISLAEGMTLNGVSAARTYDYLCGKSEKFQSLYPSVEIYESACKKFFLQHAAHPESKCRVMARPGVIDLIKDLDELKIYQACVTSAPDWQVKENIQALDIRENIKFTQMLENNEIKPKPSPDLYEIAYEKMAKLIPGLKKSEILVIEDSPNGVKSAREAGLQVIHCRMAESAPMSEFASHHAFNFEQVRKIMAVNYGISFSVQLLEENSQNILSSQLSLKSRCFL